MIKVRTNEVPFTSVYKHIYITFIYFIKVSLGKPKSFRVTLHDKYNTTCSLVIGSFVTYVEESNHGTYKLCLYVPLGYPMIIY